MTFYQDPARALSSSCEHDTNVSSPDTVQSIPKNVFFFAVQEHNERGWRKAEMRLNYVLAVTHVTIDSVSTESNEKTPKQMHVSYFSV